MSITSENYISPELTELFRHEARVHCESADYIIIMKEEQRVEYRTKVMEVAKEANWKLTDDAPFTHHMLFEVNNPMSLEEKATTATGDDSDDFDLSNL